MLTKVPPDSPPRHASVLPAPFACSLSHDGDSAWIRLAGELDLATSPQLVRKLGDAQRQPRLVVADLRRVSFADSSAMHALVDASTRAQSQGGRLVVLRGPPSVDRVFALSGIRDVVEMVHLDEGASLVSALLRLTAEGGGTGSADVDGRLQLTG